MAFTFKQKLRQLDTNAIKLWQVIQNHVTITYTYALPDIRANAVVLACFTTNITTLCDNTRIQFDALIGGEVSYNTTFILTRTILGVETEIGSHTESAGNRSYGIAHVGIYDQDNASTPFMMPIQYIDSPNVSAGSVITYKIKVYSPDSSTFYVNRTVADSDIPTHERMTSNIRLTEIV